MKTSPKPKSIKFTVMVAGDQDGSGEVLVPTKGAFKALQDTVGGFVAIINLKDSMILAVDEDGLPKRLPHNMVASTIAGQPIVGTAVLVHKSVLANG